MLLRQSMRQVIFKIKCFEPCDVPNIGILMNYIQKNSKSVSICEVWSWIAFHQLTRITGRGRIKASTEWVSLWCDFVLCFPKGCVIASTVRTARRRICVMSPYKFHTSISREINKHISEHWDCWFIFRMFRFKNSTLRQANMTEIYHSIPQCSQVMQSFNVL